jgi:hypothetical protein
MFYAALPSQSMTLYFGDPQLQELQERLPQDVTRDLALQVSKLIDSDGDDLFAEALRIGAPAKAYVKLAQFVHNEGVELDWHPRGAAHSTLGPRKAEAHYELLTRQPETSERAMLVHGTLYRIIAEPRDDQLGTIGIHLFSWSNKPPRRPGHGDRLIAPYDKPEVEQAIKGGLINEAVQARLIIRQAVLGTSIDPEATSFRVEAITASAADPKIFDEPS